MASGLVLLWKSSFKRDTRGIIRVNAVLSQGTIEGKVSSFKLKPVKVAISEIGLDRYTISQDIKYDTLDLFLAVDICEGRGCYTLRRNEKGIVDEGKIYPSN